jgi:hypothetical protein
MTSNYETNYESDSNSENDSNLDIDSNSDDDYIYNVEDFEYEPEEPSRTRYNIVICQRYKGAYIGVRVPEINYHYLVHIRLKAFNYYIINIVYNEYINCFYKCNIEIAECIYLPSGHCIAILKTFWLRLIQRVWKRVFSERKMCRERRAHPTAIRYREIYGKWPKDCCILPGLVGMLRYA